jgi:hypothetical protein
MMAIIACIFGHAEAITALNDQGYIYDSSSIMRAIVSLSVDLAERLPHRLRMLDDPNRALKLLLLIAREFDRTEAEATIVNIINLRLVGYLEDPNYQIRR